MKKYVIILSLCLICTLLLAREKIMNAWQKNYTVLAGEKVEIRIKGIVVLNYTVPEGNTLKLDILLRGVMCDETPEEKETFEVNTSTD